MSTKVTGTVEPQNDHPKGPGQSGLNRQVVLKQRLNQEENLTLGPNLVVLNRGGLKIEVVVLRGSTVYRLLIHIYRLLIHVYRLLIYSEHKTGQGKWRFQKVVQQCLHQKRNDNGDQDQSLLCHRPHHTAVWV